MLTLENFFWFWDLVLVKNAYLHIGENFIVCDSRNLEKAEFKIGQLSAGLTDVDKAVAELKEQLSRYTKEAAELQIHLARAQETISAAEGLVSKLDDEYQRWQDQVQMLDQSAESSSLRFPVFDSYG